MAASRGAMLAEMPGMAADTPTDAAIWMISMDHPPNQSAKRDDSPRLSAAGVVVPPTLRGGGLYEAEAIKRRRPSKCGGHQSAGGGEWKRC
jgi:hypothetical protein